MSLNKGSKKRYMVTAGTAGTYIFDSNALDSSGQGITATSLAALGITEIDASTPIPAKAFLAGNSPKPPRFKKPGNTIGVSTTTFAAIGTKTTDAAVASNQWSRVSSAKYKYPKLTGQTRSVFVVVAGIKYTWNMHVDLYTFLGDAGRQALGIENCDPDDYQEYVWGSTIPRPAQVSTVVTVATAGGGAIDTIKTFCAQAKENSLPTGYKIVTPRRDWTNV